ncbi:hypothetical protein Ahy_B04g071669 isoform B [Arachis hypogaea]|uniref:Uncharacterized protein n=1 Tax=Arachis hypogaea TaxID=3818 RepID=A0A444ZL90_ARAHY|nr:hypothetical protein Ahy_B04g071669 isoform B [Arachis hypogaea]
MESTTKEGLNAPSYESKDHSVPTEEPDCHFDLVVLWCTSSSESRRDRHVHFERASELDPGHHRAITHENGVGKGNADVSGSIHAERVGQPSHALLAHLVDSQHEDSTKGLGLEWKNIQKSNAIVQCRSEKHKASKTGQKGASKDSKKEVKPAAPKRKLEFHEEKILILGS